MKTVNKLNHGSEIAEHVKGRHSVLKVRIERKFPRAYMYTYKGAWAVYFLHSSKNAALAQALLMDLQPGTGRFFFRDFDRLGKGILKIVARSPPVNGKRGWGNLIRLSHSQLTTPGTKWFT